MTIVMGRRCSKYGQSKNAYRVLVGKPEGKRPFARPRHKFIYLLDGRVRLSVLLFPSTRFKKVKNMYSTY